MLGGYMGKFLWVDLTEGSIREETPDEQLLRDFVGGYGTSARLFYDLMEPGTDPLGPDNKMVFAIGPLTGTSFSGSARHCVGAKSR